MKNKDSDKNNREIDEKISKIEELLREIKEKQEAVIEEKKKIVETEKEIAKDVAKIGERVTQHKITLEKADEETEKEKQKSGIILKNPWFYFSVIASVIIILFIYKTFFFNPLGDTGTANNLLDNIQKEKFEVSADDDAFLGDENAPVTIIEFSDYQCPFCAKFYLNTLPSLKKEYIDTDKVKLIYRDFPLGFHQNAQKAAEATEAARELGGDDAFWKMHNKIFENQQAISEQDLIKYAKEIGLNENKFKEILISSKYEDEVQDDLKDGQEAGVQGTPTFFINGKILTGAQPFSEFKKIIDEELQ